MNRGVCLTLQQGEDCTQLFYIYIILNRIISTVRLSSFNSIFLLSSLQGCLPVSYWNSNEVESECHVLYYCDKYVTLRQLWLSRLEKPENFLTLPNEEKLCITFNVPSNIRCTAQYLIDLMDLRRLLNNQY